MDKHQLSRELCIASSQLEGYWIDRMEKLEAQGVSYGDPVYDNCAANLCAIASEFYVTIDDSE